MSALVFREATLSEVKGRQDWRVFDALSQLEAEHRPGAPSGGGYAYKFCEENRFIIWYVQSSYLR